jgi:hypothetical protein
MRTVHYLITMSRRKNSLFHPIDPKANVLNWSATKLTEMSDIRTLSVKLHVEKYTIGAHFIFVHACWFNFTLFLMGLHDVVKLFLNQHACTKRKCAPIVYFSTWTFSLTVFLLCPKINIVYRMSRKMKILI